MGILENWRKIRGRLVLGAVLCWSVKGGAGCGSAPPASSLQALPGEAGPSDELPGSMIKGNLRSLAGQPLADIPIIIGIFPGADLAGLSAMPSKAGPDGGMEIQRTCPPRAGLYYLP